MSQNRQLVSQWVLQQGARQALRQLHPVQVEEVQVLDPLANFLVPEAQACFKPLKVCATFVIEVI